MTQRIRTTIAGGIMLIAMLFLPQYVAASQTPSLSISNSQGTWNNIQEGSALDIYLNIEGTHTPDQYRIGINGFHNEKMYWYCYSDESLCGTTEIGALKAGTYRFTYSLSRKGEYGSRSVVYRETKTFTVGRNSSLIYPTVEISTHGTPRVGSQDFYIDAKAYGNDWKLHTIGIMRDRTQRKSCDTTGICTMRIYPNFTHEDAGKTYTYYAYAYDNSGVTTKSRTIDVYVQPHVHQDTITPTVTLETHGTAYANTSQGFSLQARARDTANNLKDITIYRFDQNLKVTTASCATMETHCTLQVSPQFTSTDVGKTYWYRASATDAAGNVGYSSWTRVTVQQKHVSQPPTHLNPKIDTSAVNGTIHEGHVLRLNGHAQNHNGVWGVEVRAQPSWQKEVIKKRCIMTGSPKDASCTLNVNSLSNRAGGTIKVWTIYWDAKTGLGYSSPAQTIRVTR